MGLRSTVSASDLAAMSCAAWAARWLAWAAARLESEVSSAVLEMKPWATSAWLLASWRWAMATWAAAAWACCAACWVRAWYSVVSMRPSTWPACTASPSRTCNPLSSPATLALTAAVLAARSTPEMGTVCTSVRVRACTTSEVASSNTVGLRKASAASAACACLAWRA